MHQLSTKRSIQEFWLDFLIEEELSCSPPFAQKFVEQCGFAGAAVKYVVHSQSDQFGETDLFVECALPSGNTVVLLVEDKITASFQLEQADRYRKRGEAGRLAGSWSAYKTVLVAPQRYLGSSDHGFDKTISLEDLAEWICPTDELRASFKRARLQLAIDKKNATGVQIVDDEMTNYRRWYSETMVSFQAKQGSRFIIPTPRLAWWGDDWIRWKSDMLPAPCEFRHMSRTGIIELGFNHVPLAQLESIQHLLGSEMQLRATGRHKQHSAIQVHVPPIKDFSDLQAAAVVVDSALGFAKRLEDFAMTNSAALSQALNGAQPAT